MLRPLVFAPLFALPLAQTLPHMERLAARLAREQPAHEALPALREEVERVRAIVARQEKVNGR